MEFRLLIDLKAVEVLNALTKTTCKRLMGHFAEIRSFPSKYSDYHEQDAIGRRIEISLRAGWAIHYWIDNADQHVKILALRAADR